MNHIYINIILKYVNYKQLKKVIFINKKWNLNIQNMIKYSDLTGIQWNENKFKFNSLSELTVIKRRELLSLQPNQHIEHFLSFELILF